MKIRKIVQKRLRESRPGADVVADVDAAIAANVGGGERSHVSSRQRVVHTSARQPRTTDEPPAEA